MPVVDPVAWAIKMLKSDGRNLKYDQYAKYLNGEHPLQFATPKFESAFGNLLRAMAYDRTNMVVDAVADRLHVTGFTAASNRGTIGKDALGLWNANGMDRRENEVEVEALGMGDGYIIVEKHPVTGNVHMWENEASHCRVKYSEEEPGKVELGSKAWVTDDDFMRLNLYHQDRIEKYITTRSVKSGMPDATGFEQYEVSDEPWPVMLDITDTVPVFHIGNNARTGGYGVSELLHAIPMQDALNKTLADLMVAMEFGAFPQKVILGVDSLPPATTLEGIEARRKLREFELGIDRILTVVGANAKAAEFTAVALAQFIATAEYFDRAISRVTRVPVHYLSMSNDFPSGAAQRMAEAPFVAKVESRQKAYGEVYGNAVEYGLRLAGVSDPGEITPAWKSASPMSVEEELNIAVQQRSIGMPLEYVLKGLSTIEETDIPNIVRAAREQYAAILDVGGFGQDYEDAA